MSFDLQMNVFHRDTVLLNTSAHEIVYLLKTLKDFLAICVAYFGKKRLYCIYLNKKSFNNTFPQRVVRVCSI